MFYVDCLVLDMSGHREILELGVFGRVPVDTLFPLYIETIRGDILTIYQTRCQASIGGWVCDLAIQKSKIYYYYLSDHILYTIHIQKGNLDAVGPTHDVKFLY